MPEELENSNITETKLVGQDFVDSVVHAYQKTLLELEATSPTDS